METFIGGLPLEDDIKRANCQIAVGAPGRIKHLIEKKVLKTNHVRLLIFDEADKLMEESFADDIDAIYQTLPMQKQVIASSATYPENLDEFLLNYMTTPTHVSPNIDTPLLLGLKQFTSIVQCNKNVLQMMTVKTTELNRILTNVPFTQCLVFSNSQIRVESISNNLNKLGWNSIFISAAMTQSKRLEIMKQLKDFKCRILLTTDLTSRGIDINNVDLVINYDVPVDVSTYLHRMGRAGRFGTRGITITIASESEELSKLKHMLAEIGGTDLSINVLPTENLNSEMFRNNETNFEQIKGEFMANYEKHSVTVLDLQIKTRKKKHKKKNTKNDQVDRLETTLSDSCDIEEAASVKMTSNECLAELKSVNEFLEASKSDEDYLQGIANGDAVSLIAALANNSSNIDIPKNVGHAPSSGNYTNLLSNFKELIPDNLKQALPNYTEESTSKTLKETILKDVKINLQDNVVASSLSESSIMDTDQEDNVAGNKNALVEETKKRKREVGSIDSKKLLYERNVSLLHITKLLIGAYSSCEIPQDVVAHVKILLKQLQLIEEEFRKNHSYVNIDNVENYVNDKQHQKQVNPDKTVEDIFKISYDYSVNASTLHWSIFLDKQEKQAIKKYKKNSQKFKKRKEEFHSDNEYQNETDGQDEFEYGANRQQNQEENFVNDDEYYNLEDYNVYPSEGNNEDYNATMNEHFANVYKQHKTKLLEFMENCKDVNEFNNFFQYWQEQLKASTDYVQQNLYLDVMNNYRYYKPYN